MSHIRINTWFLLLSAILVGCNANNWETKKIDKNSRLKKVQVNKIDADTLVVDGKNAPYVTIKHGDSTAVTLWYGGPDVLLEMKYQFNKRESFRAFFGEYSRLFPETIYLLPSNADNLTRLVYLFPNGSISQIDNYKKDDNEGACYFFDTNGVMLVSGFHHHNELVGIWRHYNTKGEILETINADTTHLNILKHFGIDE